MAQDIHMNQKDREAWYDRNAEKPIPNSPTIKIAPKGAKALQDGFNEVKTPEHKPAQAPQVSSEREKVGSKWPGPKGRVGTVLKGKASPDSGGADQVKVKPNQIIR